MNTVWIASFDIGKKNFAFCIEEINVKELQSLNNVPKSERYLTDGTCTPTFSNVLQNICLNGTIILIENIDLVAAGNCDTTKYLDPMIFISMNNVLDKYKDYWDKCASIIVEQQMCFGKKRNYLALKLGQHCYSYFIFQYANFKNIYEFPSYHKTKVLGAMKKMSKYQRKVWSVQKAMDILQNRKDFTTLNMIKSKRKRDDYCDCVVQLQAYKYLVFVDKSI